MHLIGFLCLVGCKFAEKVYSKSFKVFFFIPNISSCQATNGLETSASMQAWNV